MEADADQLKPELEPLNEDLARRWRQEVGDRRLHELAKLSSSESPIDVTLFVGGQTVCGTLCSTAEWMRLQDARVRSQFPKFEGRSIWDPWIEEAEELESARAVMLEKSIADFDSDDLKRYWSVPPALNLHSAYVMTHGGNRIPSKGDALIRILYRSVDGWSLGGLTASPSSADEV